VADDRVAISGSEVRRSGALRRTQAADPNLAIEATIVIRRPAGGKLGANSGISRAEIEKQLAAGPADMAAVSDFARRNGLSVVEESPEKRLVRVAGTVRQMNQAFGIELGQFEGPGSERFLSYDGPLTVPASVSAAITAVLGLDQQAVARPR
jgi:kumamolisin